MERLAEDHQCAALSYFTVILNLSSINCTQKLWKIRLLKAKREEKKTNPRFSS